MENTVRVAVDGISANLKIRGCCGDIHDIMVMDVVTFIIIW